jgi:hypothetical protein
VGKEEPRRRVKRRPCKPTDKYWDNVVPLLSQRDQLIAEILARSRSGTPSPLIKKAGTLLTRFWARADWKSREELLRAAQWLVNLGVTQAVVATPRAPIRKTSTGLAGTASQRGIKPRD